MTTERFMRHHYGPSGYVSPNDLKEKESSMDKNERFEIMAELFKCSTGFMAPGKSVPAELASEQYEIDRRVAWGEWSDTKAIDMAIRFIQAQRRDAEEHARLYAEVEQADTNQIMQERDNLRLRIKAVDQEHEQIKSEREKMIQAYTAVEGDRDFWKREHEGLMATLRETTNQLDTACQDKIVLEMDRDLWRKDGEFYKKMWAIRGQALEQPCLACGYTGQAIRLKNGEIP